jgi:hypothetical protein
LKETPKEIQILKEIQTLKETLIQKEILKVVLKVTLKVKALKEPLNTLQNHKPLKVKLLKKELLKIALLESQLLKEILWNKIRDHRESEASQEDLQSLICCKTLK